ncbi:MULTISPECIES: hypothetical protein [unclassified Exiguobacterium]|uniref:hypothetical protein n=1 Tax=unclassified Exiguobacterium TaxID=2644629 RepID=UPI0006AA2216|nr:MULTISPECIES: hypothetical protein [unclassified Exiguobacterium]KOP30090.1 hypothetical protein ADM98_14745 [Exiguobacterium sp. BMC-KP]HAK99771.1 hypothetical protein [Exiguobacterium sp.]
MSYSRFFTSILGVISIFFLFYVQDLGIFEKWQFYIFFMVIFVGTQALGERVLFRRFEEKRFHPQTAVLLVALLFVGIFIAANVLYP